MDNDNNNNGNQNGDKKLPAILAVGMIISVVTGIVLFVVGGVTFTFTISIVGVIVMVGGIFLTTGLAVAYAVKKAKADDRTLHEENEAWPWSASRRATRPEMSDDTEEIWDGYGGGDWDKAEDLADGYGAKRKKNLDALFDREDVLMERLSAAGKEDLADEYSDAAEKFWRKYSGDDWDENLDSIDALIDEYYARAGISNGSAAEQSEPKPEQEQTETDAATATSEEKTTDIGETDVSEQDNERQTPPEQVGAGSVEQDISERKNSERDGAIGTRASGARVAYKPMKKK